MLPIRTAAFAVTVTVILLSIRQWIYARKLKPYSPAEISGVKIRLIMLSAILPALFYVDSGLYLILCFMINLANILAVKKMTNSLTRISYSHYITDNLMGNRKDFTRPDLEGLPLFFLEPSFDSFLDSCSCFSSDDKKRIKAASTALEKERNQKSVFS